MTIATLIVAAGSGRRFGGPKQFERIDGATLLDHALASARLVSNRVVVALPAGESLPLQHDNVAYVVGGETRTESVRNAYQLLDDGFDFVLIHDAARPLASPALFERVIAALARGCPVVVPVLPSVDTLKEVEGELVRATLDRSKIVRVQTPQGFRASVLADVLHAGSEATDEAAIAEQLGYSVATVAGEERAAKITTPFDLAQFRVARVGLGFDVHPFAADGGGDLVLGGRHFGSPGLIGHSDGDCLAHAVADAVLGPAGLGGIGDLFSDADPTLRGADSMQLLASCVESARARGFRVASVDATVIAEQPRLAPHLGELGANLTDVIGAPVFVKAKRAEGLGPIGTGQGIAVFAVASLV